MRYLVALFACTYVAIGCGDGGPAQGTMAMPDDDDDSASDQTGSATGGETATASTMPSTDTTLGSATNEDSSGGGGLSPTATCNDYLACAAATIPTRLGPLIETYGPDGTCWQSTPEIAEQCDMACSVGLMQLARIYDDEPACGGGGSPGSSSGSTGGASTDGGDGGCGDGVLDPGELCDGNDLGGFTCENLGLGGGTLSCQPNCTLDTSECTS